MLVRKPPNPVGGDRAVINERVGEAVAAGAKLERTLGAVAGLNLTQVASDILGLLVKRRDLHEIGQLRVLTDYQSVAAHVYERVQGLRREVYDSSDYLEGLKAFAEKRKPIFQGT